MTRLPSSTLAASTATSLHAAFEVRCDESNGQTQRVAHVAVMHMKQAACSCMSRMPIAAWLL